MGHAQEAAPLNRQAYLEWEAAQPDKHEYIAGEVFAMVGGRRVHGRVVGNIAREFGVQLKGSPCQVFSESMKVQIGEDTLFVHVGEREDRFLGHHAAPK